MGDPAGVGPELCLKLAQSTRSNVEGLVIYGNRRILERVANQLDLRIDHLSIVDHFIDGVDEIQPGQVQSCCGLASYEILLSAIRDAQAGRIAGVVTCPINKAALNAAGLSYPGHTEILVEQTRSASHAMMLSGEEMSCSLVTTHIGLSEVAAQLTTQRIIEVGKLSAEVMERRHSRPARLTVLGLNPHAGEGGLFGNQEEERIIQPAITHLREAGYEVIGPLPPDTAFLPHIRQRTDAYICMYHDQGLIPLKTLCFVTGVNVTLGLPIVRTSVDHGTAFDIAWQGVASIDSLEHAVQFACSLV